MQGRCASAHEKLILQSVQGVVYIGERIELVQGCFNSY